MPRVPTVRKSDLDRVLKVLGAAGHQLSRVELHPNGKVVFVTGEPEQTFEVTALQRARMERDRLVESRAKRRPEIEQALREEFGREPTKDEVDMTVTAEERSGKTRAQRKRRPRRDA